MTDNFFSAMTSADSQQDLRALWHRTARRATDGQLVACVAGGLVAIGGFVTALLLGVESALHWWPGLLPAAFVAAFGMWGIADRELSERRAAGVARPVLTIVRLAAALAAAAAVAISGLLFLRATLGTWIS
jgi:hypothetical protein